MTDNYKDANISSLLKVISQADLRYRRICKRHHSGKHLRLKVQGIFPAIEGEVRLRIEHLAGGGFAGQVYRGTLLGLDPPELTSTGLRVGGTYAIKIHVPPSRFSRWLRDFIYWIGFQGSFSPRVNADAARAGALWQKLIRQGAICRFGDEGCVADIHATLFDPEMASFGEINEWVDGRGWRLEIDREVFSRHKRSAKEARYSREYLAKKEFMAQFVTLLHDMGAAELARQYEWWTLKSQPNVLKRSEADGRPEKGLTALDFRPGLALLCLLPMSPADFKLILGGVRKGSLVQFDRGDLDKLRTFCRKHIEEFEGLETVLNELCRAEPRYRNALPDITHHGFQLLCDGRLRRTVREGLIRGWRSLRLIDEGHTGILQSSRICFWLFYFTGAIPFVGRRVRLYWGNPDYRRHLVTCLGSLDYLRRSLRAGQAECLDDWYLRGKVGREGVEFFLVHSLLFTLVRIFPGMLPLPVKLHRALIDWKYALEKARTSLLFPLRFYRSADFRLAWLNEEVEKSIGQGMMRQEEKERILSQIGDPFIQKYLKCMAVHFCTFPITRLVMLLVGVWAYFRYGNSWQESMGYALAAVLLIGVVLPVTPGSLVRGFYVLYLMIRERNIRNYWLAATVSFWRFVGYLGFPLQMVKAFPALTRLIASGWVARAVKVVPVFGEEGALLEHLVFDLCVNVPLSIRRKIRKKKVPARIR